LQMFPHPGWIQFPLSQSRIALVNPHGIFQDGAERMHNPRKVAVTHLYVFKIGGFPTGDLGKIRQNSS